ncbi:MAG TPA: BTAD domain-containing putative transcriptional regulator [Streptosporangiaceae bacterium]
MSAGHAVSMDRLAELIWPDRQPERVRASLQTLATRLRAVVPGVIVSVGDGYLLKLDPDHVDLLHFRRLVCSAQRADDPGHALGLLDAALGLWRGEPLAGLGSAAMERDLVPALIEERLAAIERRADLHLAAGQADRVIAEMLPLTGQHPLRESLWAQLIRALSDGGRSAEAIQQYHKARELLAGELGVDPSPDMQDLYLKLLQADRQEPVSGHWPASVPDTQEEPIVAAELPGVPHQLPAATAGFVGRTALLKVLTEHADEVTADQAMTAISAISGMAGAGKTALALHWAHREAARFPDGQLYADLRGFDPSAVPAPPAEVIRGLIGALGVSAARIPTDLDAILGLYRTVLAGRRVLIVLDNARDAEQIRPLLPGSPGCMVVVTSRCPLIALAAQHGARLINLDVLAESEAAELMTARLGAERMATDPGAAAELVSLCGGLPLALAISAARAAASPQLPLAVFAAELRDVRRRLDALDGGDRATNVRAVFSWSCRYLGKLAAYLFVLLGVHPGPDISLSAAASLAGTGRAETTGALAELTARNLISERRPGRYVLHDLVRVFAAEQASARFPADEVRAAIRRMLDYYLRTAHDADAQMNPQHHPLPFGPPDIANAAERFASSQQGMEWFDAEYQVLVEVTGLAARTGFDSHAWQIPTTFARYLDRCGRWQSWADIQRTALAAVERLGNKNAEAWVLRLSGLLSLRLAAYREAHDQFSRALQLYSALDDQVGQARAHGDIAMTFAIQERYREALVHSGNALDLVRSADHPYVYASALNKVGWHAAHLGDYEYALACCQQALELLRGLGYRSSQAYVWDSLGYIHHRLNHHAESIDCLQRAVSIFREVGNVFELAATLNNLGDACSTFGQPVAARDAWQQALIILTDLGHPDSAQLEAKLGACDENAVSTPVRAASRHVQHRRAWAHGAGALSLTTGEPNPPGSKSAAGLASPAPGCLCGSLWAGGISATFSERKERS